MLNDEIQECIIQESESNDLINSEILKNFLNTNYRDIFEKYGFLRFKASSYCKLDISSIFPNYFIMQEDEDEETISEDDIVYLVLTYMSFIYYKKKEGLFNDSSLVYDLNLE